MDTLWQDIRFSLAAMRRRRGLTCVVVVSLALGVGLVSAVFSVVESVLLRPLPFPGSERLVEVAGVRHRGAEVDNWLISYLDFRDWGGRIGGAIRLGAYSDPSSFTLLGEGPPVHLDGELVAAGYFEVLGVAPLLGRVFSAEEDRTADPRFVVILGHDVWRQRFGGNRGVVGSRILLNGGNYQVVGVMRPGFRGATDGAQIWVPLNMASQILGSAYVDYRPLRWLTAVGRLAPGATVTSAQTTMDAATAALAREHPDSNQGIGVHLTPLREAWVGDLRRTLFTTLAGAGLVLLIACANVSGLLLTQALERRQEISLRTAIGASRARLARQLLTESLVLALFGCSLGLLLALAATRLLDVSHAAGLRSFVDVSPDPRVVGATLGLSLLCAVGFGLAPLWVAWRTDVAAFLKEGERGSRRQRLQSLLVGAEVALSLALVVAAGVVIRGFEQFQHVDLGYRTGILTARLNVDDRRAAREETFVALLSQMVERIGALPGVRSVALEGPGLPTENFNQASFTVEDRRDPADDGAFTLFNHAVTPAYFSTLGIPLRQGRLFSDQDDKRVRPWSIVVSESAARRLWPAGRAVGKRLKLGPRASRFPWFVVIGVVADARHQGLSTAPDEMDRKPEDVYFTALQFPPIQPPTVNFLVRPAGGATPESLAGPVRRTIQSLAAGLAVYDAATLAERVHRQTARSRLLVELMGLLSLLALTLAAIGIYGIVANSVAQRSREIGIRIALGADRGGVIGWLVKRGVLLAAAGVAVGLPAAAVLSRLLERHRYGLGALDPPTFAGAALVLLGTAALTSLIAARRASRIEPSAALRMK